MTTPRDDIAGLSERLRSHVNDRGGRFKDDDGNIVIPNGAWSMMLEAATQLDSLLKERDALNKDLAQTQAHLAMRNGDLAEAVRERDALQASVEYFEADQEFHKAQADKIRRLEDLLRDEKATVDALQARVKELEGSFTAATKAYDRTIARALRAEQERDKLQAQLPEGMKHCTITFHECEKGHGWLHATNWIDNGCPWCQRDEAYERLKPFADAAEKLDDDEDPIGDVMWPDDQPTAGNIRAARDLVRRLAGPEKEKKE